jgi:hypothetical protein
MIVDLWYIIPAGCISLSISLACCLFCMIPQKNNNMNYSHISTNERTVLLEDDMNPPPYKERENTNIVLIM